MASGRWDTAHLPLPTPFGCRLARTSQYSPPMPAIVAGLRFPYSRVMLPRTRLAYVHLRNLLTDAKRDRSARLSGYVAIWLPEEFLVLYLQHGEVVNATVLDGKGSRAIAISSALEAVPSEPEYGE